MKKLIFGLALTIGASSFAQNAKPSASYSSNAAQGRMEFDAKDYLDAKVYLDAAYEQMISKQKSGAIIKPKIEAKIYNYRGQVYLQFSHKAEPKEKIEFVEIATDMLTNERKVDSKKYFYDNATRGLTMCANKYHALSADKYEAKEYVIALQFAEKAIEIRENLANPFLPTHYNAALSAMLGENYDRAIYHFDKLISEKYEDDKGMVPALYGNKVKCLKAQDKIDEAFKVIQEGRAAYPKDKDLFTAEVDYYLQTGDNEKAFENLDKLIADEPTNPLYHALKGDLYDMLAKKEEDVTKIFAKHESGIASYMKAIEINPEYHHPHFNSGVLYINMANMIMEERDALPLSEAKKAKALEEKEQGYYQSAIKMFTACTVIDPNDISAFDALRKIYVNLGEYDKSGEMKKKVEELQAQ